jgi:hypothetical protein
MAKGETLRYRYTFDHNDLVWDNSYTVVRESEIVIEDVDASGNMTVTVRRLDDTLISRNAPVSNSNFLVRPDKPPLLIRARVTPWGELLSATILIEDSTMLSQTAGEPAPRRIMEYPMAQVLAESGLPVLPRREMFNKWSVWSDTLVDSNNRYDYRPYYYDRGSRMDLPVDENDTTFTVWSLLARPLQMRYLEKPTTLKLLFTSTVVRAEPKPRVGRRRPEHQPLSNRTMGDIHLGLSDGAVVRRQSTTLIVESPGMSGYRILTTTLERL